MDESKRKSAAEKNDIVQEYPYGHVEQSLDRLQRANQEHITPTIHYLTKYGGKIATLTETAAKGMPEGGGE